MHGLIFETSIWLLAGSTRLNDGGIGAAEANRNLPRGLQYLQPLQFQNCISTFLRQSAKWKHANECSPKKTSKTWFIIETENNDQQSLLSHRPEVESIRNKYKMQLHESLVSGFSSRGADTTGLHDSALPDRERRSHASPVGTRNESWATPEQKQMLPNFTLERAYTPQRRTRAGTSHFHVGHREPISMFRTQTPAVLP